MRDRADAAAARWAARLVHRIRPEDAERISERVLATIDDVSANRWEAAKRRAADLPGSIRPDRIDALTRSMSRELSVAGAAAGAAAVAPGVGTGATLASSLAEFGWFTGRAGDLVLTIAALHGRDDPTVDERRAWVLAVLIYGSSAKDGFNQAVRQVSEVSADQRLTLATIQMANRVMSRSMLRRYGTRRGVIAIGRALPIGLGALIGGGANYRAVRQLARDADRFFATMPYSAIDVDSTDVTDRRLP